MIGVPEPAFASVDSSTGMAKLLEGSHDKADSGDGVRDEDDVEVFWDLHRRIGGV